MNAGSQAGGDRSSAGPDRSRRFIESGLAELRLDAGADEIAIIHAVHAIYGPALEALMSEGFDEIPHEPGADMSGPPRAAPQR